MFSVIDITFLIALFFTHVRSQNSGTISLAAVSVRGNMEYDNTVLTGAPLAAKRGSLQSDICSYITDILSNSEFPKRLSPTCLIKSVNEATGVVDTMVSLQFKSKHYQDVSLSPTFTEDTLNRLFYSNNQRYGFDHKLIVPMTRTTVYLFGPVRKNNNKLMKSSEWTGSAYAEAGQKICEALRSRLDEDYYFKRVRSFCRMSAVLTEGCDAMVQISFENEHLKAVGLTLDYDTVAWAVQNAVLFEILRNDDLTYHSVVQSVDYIQYLNFYMLKGPLKYNKFLLQFPTQEDAQNSPLLRDAIRQLSYATVANRWMDSRYAEYEFSFKFKQYNKDDHSITLLCKMHSSGYRPNFEVIDLIQTFPFPLENGIVEYKPVVIINERIPKPTVNNAGGVTVEEAEENSLIILRRGPVDNLNQYFGGNPRNKLPDSFILPTEHVCKPTSPFETVYGAVVQLKHTCLLDSFERYSLLATTRFKIPISELKAKGLHPEDIQILWG